MSIENPKWVLNSKMTDYQNEKQMLWMKHIRKIKENNKGQAEVIDKMKRKSRLRRKW